MKTTLPIMCAALMPGTREPIVIKRGESGYYPLPEGYTVDEINKLYDASPAEVEAMLAGSMFGWDCPGADPDSYKRKVKG